MVISTADHVRRLIGDPIRRTAEHITGDGTATAFWLSGAPIYSATAGTVFLVSGDGAQTATGGTAWTHKDGIIAFATAISANSAALVNYQWSVLSEEEIETITALNAGLPQMAVAAIEMIQGDYARMVKWSIAQGPEVDPTKAAEHLASLWKQWRTKIDEDERQNQFEGGQESWAEFDG